MALVFFLYALFASVFTISKTALQFTAPYFLIGTRMMAAGVLMIAYQWFFNRDQLTIKKAHFGHIFKLSFFAIYLTNVCEFWGLQYLTSFKTCFIYSLSPFISALFSYYMVKDSMNSKKWLGLLIGFLGFLPILLSQSEGEAVAGQLFIFSFAEISVTLAVIFSVYGWIILKKLVDENNYSPLTANGFSMLIGGVFAITHSLLTENWNPVPVKHFFSFFESAISLMIISNFLAYNLYGYLLRRYTATFMSVAGFTTALFTALFGYLFLGETITLPFYISSCIVFLGLWVFHQEELKLGVAQNY